MVAHENSLVFQLTSSKHHLSIFPRTPLEKDICPQLPTMHCGKPSISATSGHFWHLMVASATLHCSIFLFYTSSAFPHIQPFLSFRTLVSLFVCIPPLALYFRYSFQCILNSVSHSSRNFCLLLLNLCCL